MLNEMHEMVHRFNRDLIGLPIPDKPTLLTPTRMTFRVAHINEELTEIKDAFYDTDIEGVADGLLDLIYVAMGALIEMGVTPGAAFEEVHRANMGRVRGEKATRPGSLGFDAVKPEGWQPPDLEAYLTITREQVRASLATDAPPVRMVGFDRAQIDAEDRAQIRGSIGPPKILVLGHGRHGKDTVAAMLGELCDLRFTSSSIFCAERVILQAIYRGHTPELEALQGKYNSVSDCFNDRHNHRKLWYDAIRAFNRSDATALGRAIFEDHDIYCGLRSKAEFNALRNAGLVDYVVWVDASDRLPPEGSDSCTVEPWMADFALDNNGTQGGLARNVRQLAGRLT